MFLKLMVGMSGRCFQYFLAILLRIVRIFNIVLPFMNNVNVGHNMNGLEIQSIEESGEC